MTARGSQRSRVRDARGAATVLGIGFIGLILTVALVAVGITAVIAAHRRAQSAADLAALAAASGYQRGVSPCDEAQRIAEANGGHLISCALDGPVATVEVECSTVLGDTFQMHGRAKAGPGGIDEDMTTRLSP